jgi:uncharacterized protein
MDGAEKALLEAVRQGDVAALRRWLADRPGLAALPLRDGTSPVTLAARLGRVDSLRVLLEAGAAARTPEGDPGDVPTALMLAAAQGEEEVVALLLEHGADPALRDRQGRTAADWAAAQGHQDLAARLGTVAEAERTVWSGEPTDAVPPRETPGSPAR